jgi:hypothetical protein
MEDRKKEFEEAMRKRFDEKNKHLHYKLWPPSLAKAVDDPFDYAMGLRDGTIIYFHHATFIPPDGEWVHLDLGRNYVQDTPLPRHKMIFNTSNLGHDRGVEIRVSEIVWVADAPHGS